MISVPEALQRVTRLAPLTDVLARIDALVAPVPSHEVDVAMAAGRVLAAEVVAQAPWPRHAVALRDGFAVRSELLTDAGPYAPVALVPPPDWVEIGDPIPGSADAVLEGAAVTIGGGFAEAVHSVGPGDGILVAGGDVGAGNVLCRAGERLRGTDIAVLRGAGVGRVRVRVPRLRIVAATPGLSPADEFVAAWVARAVEVLGGVAEIVRTGEEDGALERAIGDCDHDAVITIGGTGTGRRDHAVRTAARVGRLEFHGVGLSPGTTAALATAGARSVLLLPGRFDAALATFLVLGRRLIAGLSGLSESGRGASIALRRKIVSTVGLSEIVLLRLRPDGVEPIAREAFPLSALSQADGFVLVPAQSEGIAPGTLVDMQALP